MSQSKKKKQSDIPKPSDAPAPESQASKPPTLPKLSTELQQKRKAIIKQINSGRSESKSVASGSDLFETRKVEFISTGIVGLDYITGGGLVKGRLIELYGPTSSGKTTVAMMFARTVQRNGGLVYFADVEHALDIAYAQKLGVDMDRFDWDQNANLQEVLEGVEQACRSGAYGLVVIDSIAALVSAQEIKKKAGEDVVGGVAKALSHALKILSEVCADTKTTLLMLNQRRFKIGQMFGNPETTSGGEAPGFYASQRFRMEGCGYLQNDNGLPDGIKSKMVCKKSKVSRAFLDVVFDIRAYVGIDPIPDFVNRVWDDPKCGINKNGSYVTIDGENAAQGRERFAQLLRARPSLFEQLYKRVQIFYATPEDQRYSLTFDKVKEL